MIFTRRATWVFSGIGLALLVAQGCASGNKSGDASTQPTSRPVPETVVVELNAELGPFAPRARGVLRPKPTLAAPLLTPLGPLVEPRGAAELPVLITIGDSVKFDGAFPGDSGIWSKWDQGVEDLLKKQLTDPRPLIVELWKEPDAGGAFKGDRLNFFAAWVHTVPQIRHLAPKATIAGPGISKSDNGWVQEFLKYAKDWNVSPDVVSWHEDGLKHDISGHVGGLAEAMWQDGTGLRPVAISPNNALDAKAHAGDHAIFLAQMEKSAKSNADRPLTQEFQVKLTHLFTGDLKLRSTYFTYREYASLTNAGRSMKVSPSPTIEGVAVYSGPQRTARILLGRSHSRVSNKQVLGDVTLHVKGAAGATVHARLTRIADTGAKASAEPVVLWEGDAPIANGEVKLALGAFNTGDAYTVELNVRGSPATTRAASRPTTGPATKSSTLPSR